MSLSALIISTVALGTIISGVSVPATWHQEPAAKQSAPAPTGKLHFKAPAEWVSEPPSSNMRVAQYRLPKTEGDGEDASLVLYFFGSNQGGSVQANLDRWLSQIEQPDGSASSAKAKSETLTINQLKVITIDLVGTYVAETAPGSGVHHNKPDYRLRAAVVETPRGTYYVKLVGPTKTLNRWDKSFVDYLRSFEFK